MNLRRAFLISLLLLPLAGCSGSGSPSGPVCELNNAGDNATAVELTYMVEPGNTVELHFEANKSVSRVRIFVDDSQIDTRPVTTGDNVVGVSDRYLSNESTIRYQFVESRGEDAGRVLIETTNCDRS